MNKDNEKSERSNASNTKDDRTIRHETIPGEDNRLSKDKRTDKENATRSTTDEDLN